MNFRKLGNNGTQMLFPALAVFVQTVSRGESSLDLFQPLATMRKASLRMMPSHEERQSGKTGRKVQH